ncbi:hypothetical protein JCGZ_00997 [Jatropha curcas]|uniref:F-box domain-containing protein n=1 Tax=Jatropha curcas TaxID=180498 RepID=A0A067L438_JATCU|nr:F-box protein At2g17036 [Jatropha curcas]KDP39240.1 hypothetical protein JCGZ_00997 [Jatropha curcas]
MACSRGGEMITPLSWSTLPVDLLTDIAKHLDTYFDVLHFRSVCHSWRTSVPAPKKSPSLPLELNFLTDDPFHPFATFSVYRRTVFRLEPEGSQHGNSWLIKVQEESDAGKLLVTSPFSRYPIYNLPPTFPRELNLLSFRVWPIASTFSLERHDEDEELDSNDVTYHPMEIVHGGVEENDNDSFISNDGVTMSSKVTVSASETDSSLGVCALIRGEFYSMKVNRDQEWNSMDIADTYRDIINYKGDIYAVLRNGTGSRTDANSLTTTHLILPPRPFTGERYLVESCGDLFLVSRDYSICASKVYYDDDTKCYFKKEGVTDIPFKFEVFKLNTVSPTSPVYHWDVVNDLGDQIFCLSKDCSFSVSAQDFAGSKGNCIYFVDELYDEFDDEEDVYDDDLVDDTKIFVFNLEDGYAGPLASSPGFPNIFWPPPLWLRTDLPPLGN